MERLPIIAEFFRAERAVSAQIVEIFGKDGIKNTDILYGISQNKTLFLLYCRSNCRKYSCILETFDSVRPGEIIIYLAELELYGVFANSNYHQFCKAVRERQEDRNIRVNLHQIILDGQEQRLVFVSNGPVENLRAYVRDHLKSEIIATGEDKCEVTVIKPLSESARDSYDSLYNYIYRKDKKTAASINPLQILREREYKYTSPVVNDTISANTLEELMALLRAGNITVNATTINNYGTIANINIGQLDSKQSTSDWIRDNPPGDRELSTDYYARYTRSLIGIPSNRFGTIVKKCGYTYLKSGGKRYWVAVTEGK